MSIVLFKGKIGAEDCFLDAATHVVMTSKKTTREVTGLASVFLPLTGGTVTGAMTLTASGTALTVTNSASFGQISVGGAASVGGGLFVTGVGSFGGQLTASGGLSVSGTFTAASLGLSGGLTVGTTLGVTGAATFAGGVTITSGGLSAVTASFSSTLGVSGASTFSGLITATAGLTVASGAINFTGATSFNITNVSSNGVVSLTKGSGTALAVTANISVGGGITVVGVSTLTGGIEINSQSFTHSLADSAFILSDKLKVYGDLWIQGDIEVNGNGVVKAAANTGCAHMPDTVDALPTAGASYLNQLYVRNSEAGSYGVYFCVRYGVNSYKWMALSAEPVGGGTAEQLEYTWTPA